MTERRTKPVDWSELNPEIGELLEKDRRFLSAARSFFGSSEDDAEVAATAFESVRASLRERDSRELIDDEYVVSELERAYLYLADDKNYLDKINREITEAIN